MKIELELSDAEITYLSQNCLERVLKSAMSAVPANYEYMQDLEDAIVFELIRSRIVNAVFAQKAKVT